MVTKEKFEQYAKFVQSGTPNMADPKVRERTGLSQEDCLDILQNYVSYVAKFKVSDEAPEALPVEEPEEEETEEEEEAEPEEEEPEEEVDEG